MMVDGFEFEGQAFCVYERYLSFGELTSGRIRKPKDVRGWRRRKIALLLDCLLVEVCGSSSGEDKRDRQILFGDVGDLNVTCRNIEVGDPLPVGQVPSLRLTTHIEDSGTCYYDCEYGVPQGRPFDLEKFALLTEELECPGLGTCRVAVGFEYDGVRVYFADDIDWFDEFDKNGRFELLFQMAPSPVDRKQLVFDEKDEATFSTRWMALRLEDLCYHEDLGDVDGLDNVRIYYGDEPESFSEFEVEYLGVIDFDGSGDPWEDNSWCSEQQLFPCAYMRKKKIAVDDVNFEWGPWKLAGRARERFDPQSGKFVLPEEKSKDCEGGAR